MATNLPPFWKFLGPVLDALRELGGSGTPVEVTEVVARTQKITEEQQNAILKSGSSSFGNRVRWARQYLVWAGLLDASKRGVWSLTEQGLAKHLSVDDAKALFKAVHAKVSATGAPAEQLSASNEIGESDNPSGGHR